MIDIRLIPYRDSSPEQATVDPIDWPGGGWKPDHTPEQIWNCNRGYYPFEPARVMREQYATMSVRGGKVVVAARLSGIQNVGPVPPRDRDQYALVGEVLKPADPEYDRLMGMMIPPHRWFTYIDDGTQLPEFTCLCGCGTPVRGPNQFASGHGQRAITDRITRRWGSTVEFVKWFDGPDSGGD
jgi:hypothetical protein